MRLTLFCQAGVTTGILVARMREYAQLNDDIAAYEFASIHTAIVNSDVVLIAPQLKSHYKEIKKICNENHVPFLVIEVNEYNINNYKKIYNNAVKIFRENNKTLNQ